MTARGMPTWYRAGWGPCMRRMRAGTVDFARYARPVVAGADGIIWFGALAAASWLRYDMELAAVSGSGLLILALVGVATQWTLGILARTYRGRYWPGSLD